MSATRSVVVSLMSVILCAGMTGCERDGPAERAGEKVDEAAKDVKEGVAEAAEEVEEGADRLEDRVKD